MLEKSFVHSLQQCVGRENVLTDKEDIICYSYDPTPNHQIPEAVVIPGTIEEISQVVMLANQAGIPITPRGGGSNICGNSIPIKGGIVLAMHRFDRIIEIDTANLCAVVQAGVITADFQRQVEALGLFYPPDPQASSMSMLGGNVATNAGGPRGFKYGVTRDYVLGFKMVLADGRILKMGGKTVKNVTGYDLTKLFVGSEGTLGIFTELILRLIPLPESKRTMLAVFDDLLDAARTVSGVIAAKIIPTTLEFMDREAMRLIEAYVPCGLPVDAAAAILIEVDGSERDVPVQIKQVEEVCRQFGAREIRIATTEAESNQIWAGRKAAFSSMAKSAPTLYVEDVTVPRSKIPDIVKTITDLAAKYQLKIPILGHAGDGNMHPIILTDENNHDEIKRVKLAIDEMFKAALELGGTLSGEHGIGLDKVKFMEWELGETGIDVMRKIKHALDPRNIMNSNKVLPAEAVE
ncbi:FAD-binding oxidoreductase [Desulfosporosinus sp. BICA1-9]|uniref:FAD-binding oxidoreductase n=1 Tax=Desulfosporosinus sp. BICA1-9 TaxID=1531958 RepID=UPI00054B2536|nr:FAD-linked oxidase C-terminal domain-containing protein [Desulfosporosinus sp. BICA1-9]KJS49098.1 MAG: FAD-binding protein [Peptococcaceae bacterium BRH_c23]KJS89805.1 MAG: FAD-binding protein [Desulfosporosinus sp. BICA1-9]